MPSDFIDIRVWTDLVNASRDSFQASTERAGGAVATRVPEIDSLLLNRIFGAELASIEELESLCRSYPAAGIPRHFVHVPDDAMTNELAELFGRLGIERFRRDYIELRRGREAVAPIATDLEVREARAADGEQLAAVFAKCFGMPEHGAAIWPPLIGREGWHASVAMDGDTVAGAGLLCVSQGEGYLAGGATATDYRRRGVQGALMSWRVQRALDAGCERIWTETGEKVEGDPNHSYNNMLRHGFEPVARRLNFAPAGTRW